MYTEPKLYAINYLQCQKGFKTSERVLDTPYFLYVHKGKGIYAIGKTQYQCKAGDLFFCPKGVPNTIIADDDDPYLLSGVDFTFGRNGEDKLHSVDVETSSSTGAGQKFTWEFKEHINLYNHLQFSWITMELIQRNAIGDMHYNQYVQSLFNAWLVLVANLSNTTLNSSLAENVAVYLAANDNRNLSLSEISEEFRYHPNHINRIFRKRFDATIKQYHNDIRIKKAMQLLAYSHYSIGEVSALCGYDDLNYFSRLFKHKTHVSPLKYRKKLML